MVDRFTAWLIRRGAVLTGCRTVFVVERFPDLRRQGPHLKFLRGYAGIRSHPHTGGERGHVGHAV